MIVWVIAILLIAVVLAAGIERLIARLGVRNQDTGSRGLALVAERLEEWTAERRRR